MKSGKPIAVLLVAVILLLLVPQVISMVRGKAPTPDVFSGGYSLDQASQLSSETGKPIYVLATADWCAPCQALKRGALSDPAVTELISSRTIPVYLEDGTNKQEIQALGVRAYPTTMLIENGKVVLHAEGGASASKYAQMLRSELPKAP